MDSKNSKSSRNLLNCSDNDCYVAKTREHLNSDDKDWYITGGSSGGSAVAVATGTVFGY